MFDNDSVCLYWEMFLDNEQKRSTTLYLSRVVNDLHCELIFECRRKGNKTRLSLPNCYIATAVKNCKHIKDLQDKLIETEVLPWTAAFFIVNNLTFRKKIQIANICFFRYRLTRANGALQFRVSLLDCSYQFTKYLSWLVSHNSTISFPEEINKFSWP